jgi:hypothetical protein
MGSPLTVTLCDFCQILANDRENREKLEKLKNLPYPRLARKTNLLEKLVEIFQFGSNRSFNGDCPRTVFNVSVFGSNEAFFRPNFGLKNIKTFLTYVAFMTFKRFRTVSNVIAAQEISLK